jgi:hypothetical protein
MTSRILCSLALTLGACAVQDSESTDSNDLTRFEAKTQSACTVRTPTSWVVNGVVCSNPWRADYPLEIGESVVITDSVLGRGYQEVACTTSGLTLVAEECLGNWP